MTTEITDAKIKDLIAKPENRIELHDLVDKETEKLLEAIQAFNLLQGQETLAAAKTWIKEIEEKSSTLIKIFAYGCYFGMPEHSYLWQKSLERLAGNRPIDGLLHKLQLYPVMLVLYAGGLSAIAAKNSANLKSLLSSRISYEHHDNTLILGYDVNGWLLNEHGNQIFGTERKIPTSDHVLDVLKEAYPQSLLRDSSLEATFDKWEVLSCMAVAFDTKDEHGNQWAPTGRFSWTRNGQLDAVKAEIESEKSAWQLIELGMFNKDVEEALAALEFVRQVARSR
jgi:hypothetical protein